MEIIREWLQPGIIVVVGIAILGFLGRLSARMGNVEKDIVSIKKDVEYLSKDIADVKEYVKTEIASVRSDLSEVRADVRVLMQTAAFAGNSPLKLTPRGKEVVEMVGGRQFIHDNEALLLGSLAKRLDGDKDQFSVQLIAREVVEENIINLLNSETKEKLGANGVDLPLLAKSLSILLRDIYLEQ